MVHTHTNTHTHTHTHTQHSGGGGIYVVIYVAMLVVCKCGGRQFARKPDLAGFLAPANLKPGTAMPVFSSDV